MLQIGDGVGGPGVILALHTKGIEPAKIERLARPDAISVAVAPRALLRDGIDPDAFDGRRGAGEIALDQTARQSDRIENLRAAIALESRDAHFGHDLEQALSGCGDELARARGPRAHRVQTLEREIGVDRFGAIAREDAEMMDLARFAGLDHQSGLDPQALADELMMDRARGQCRGNRDSVGPGRTVRQYQHVDVGQHRLGRFPAQPLQRGLQRLARAAGPRRIERRGTERAVDHFANRTDLGQILVRQDRLGDFEPLECAGMVTE